jgi:hypothetical protein
MKKPAIEAVAAAENATAAESATAAEGSHKLVSLLRSLLRSSLHQRNWHRNPCWFPEWCHEKGDKKDRCEGTVPTQMGLPPSDPFVGFSAARGTVAGRPAGSVWLAMWLG